MSDAGAPRDHLAGSTFAHASEAEFARILDFYQVAWEYEPQVFPILWDLDGNVLESFAPDFFLPELDLYIELTTLQQRLVRKKNRKVRRLRELYPNLRIKLFYARDFRALMLKYGRSALVSELSGTLGQVGPRQNPESGREESSAARHPTVGRPLDLSTGSTAATLDPRASHDRRSRGARRRAVRRAATAYAPNSTAT
jgi:hypoxanthine phosphoribosyltransferase